MTQTLIKTLNQYVNHDDTLYFLGDFAFQDHRKIPDLRARINCQTIHFILGNHDHHITKYKECFASIQTTLDLVYNKQPIFLSHYAHRVWQGSHKGFIHLYGHSHGSIPDYGKSMDVGVDAAYRLTGEYRPFSADEIIAIMAKRDVAYVGHHDSKTNVK